jgi:hypothetical protein
MIDYDGRVFRPVSNVGGEVGAETVFAYRQRGRIVTADYSGGAVVVGHLIGIVDDEGLLDLRYHQVNTAGELRTGTCRTTPEVLDDGRLRLHEAWRWTSGDGSAGTSVLEEDRADR